MSLRGATALVGAYDTAVGVVPDRTATELCAEAIRGAVADAGLDLEDVDGLITCNSMAQPILYHAEAMAEYLQMYPHLCMTLPTGGGTTVSALAHAAAAIQAGTAGTVVMVMADSLRSGLTRDQAMRLQSSTGHPDFEQPYGPTVPAYYALIAQAHMATFGTTPEQLARVAVDTRAHAARNETAQMRDLITVDDVLNSRPIADPLRLLECSLVSDGGAAVVLTSAERARDLKQAPVYCLGFGEGHSHEHISQARDLTTSAAAVSGAAAYAMAGVSPSDFAFAQLYDCFTPTVLVELEDLGFCAKGEGGAYLESEGMGPGARLPVNTHGGMLSHCHPGNPGAMFGLTEAIRQLRGDCGERQVENANLGLFHAQGGIMSSHATLVLGREC
ncbi:thiolase [Luminiphilus syltensis NOR5-1B]|uniref:Thiolase n=1 Tax=Luminiphilus syltensis NOR5-1B TaxID=565045 RepID=B8KQH0_9GAMM|nr:thiolase [Luminiphilus syltensis]EED36743.1 thiolase [Luminiphilus syltensis NOR5-1B]